MCYRDDQEKIWSFKHILFISWFEMRKKLVLPKCSNYFTMNPKDKHTLQYTEIQIYMLLEIKLILCGISLKNLFVCKCDILMNHFHDIQLCPKRSPGRSSLTLRRSISLIQSARALASIKSNI